jgi:hypothetical protein
LSRQGKPGRQAKAGWTRWTRTGWTRPARTAG